MQTTADRIEDRMKLLGVSQADIKRATGAGKATISSWVKGDTTPSGNYASKLASFLDCRTDWLLTGKGEPTEQKPSITEFLANTAHPTIISKDNDHRIQIPFYDLSFCCGDGKSIAVDFIEQRKTIGFEEHFFEKRGLSPQNCKLITAHGNSMQYYICDGDAVMIDIASVEPLENEVFAVYFEGERMIRRFEKRQGGVISLVADNPTYKEKLVTDPSGSGFKIVGRVVYRSG